MRKRKAVNVACEDINNWIDSQLTKELEQTIWEKSPSFILEPLIYSLYHNLNIYTYQKQLDEINLDAITKQDLSRLAILADLLEQQQLEGKESQELQNVAQSILNKYRNPTNYVNTPCGAQVTPLTNKRDSDIRYQKQRQTIQNLINSPTTSIEDLSQIHLDEKAKEKYIQAYCSKSPLGRLEQDRVREILSDLRLISPQEFLDKFNASLKTLETALDGRIWSPGAVLETKSNLWLLQNALKLSPTLKKTMKIQETKNGKLDYHDIPNIVFFDDIIYSGKQMAENIEQLFYSKVSKDIRLWVVVTMITKRGVLKILEQVKELVDDKKLNSIGNVQLIFQEILSPNVPSDKITQTASKFSKYSDILEPLLAPNYSVILPFKMPDYVSSFPAVYWGYIPPLPLAEQTTECENRDSSQFIPFIKGCESTFNRAYHRVLRHPLSNKNLFALPHLECPTPPYKKSLSREYLISKPSTWETSKKLKDKELPYPALPPTKVPEMTEID